MLELITQHHLVPMLTKQRDTVVGEDDVLFARGLHCLELTLYSVSFSTEVHREPGP